MTVPLTGIVKVFGRRPPVCAAPPSWGRHPQTFTLAEVTNLREQWLTHSGIPAYCNAQVLLIDHDVDLIAATCTQTLVMDFGRLLALGPTQEVLRDPAVRRAYLGT